MGPPRRPAPNKEKSGGGTGPPPLLFPGMWVAAYARSAIGFTLRFRSPS